jgi:hypothetical protein
LSFPFATSFDSLSPRTRNHKIQRIEAEVIGSDAGDSEGIVWLSQSGTSVVNTLNDVISYYRFPERSAGINTFFNGVRSRPPEIYTNVDLRDRPFVNTHWDMVFDQVGEPANRDVNLTSLTDIRLHIFFSDFVSY